MGLTKVTRNFQVTLPAKIRKKLGVKEGDYIEIVDEDGVFVIRKLSRERKVITLGKESSLTPEEIEKIITKGMKACMQ